MHGPWFMNWFIYWAYTLYFYGFCDQKSRKINENVEGMKMTGSMVGSLDFGEGWRYGVPKKWKKGLKNGNRAKEGKDKTMVLSLKAVLSNYVVCSTNRAF